MHRHGRIVRVVGVAAVAATVLAACSSSGGTKNSTPKSSSAPQSSNGNGADVNVAPAFNAATVGWVNKTTKTGGTLKLEAQSDCDSWDPANTYYGWCFNMQRLISRTLVGYSDLPGSNNIKIEPDMATALGQHSADFKTWTYTLKPGLKYEDGTAITTMDIKHAMGRLFATDVINGGPTSYYVNTINAPSTYKGVYKSGELPDTAIETPNATTIIFHLKVSYSDFDYLMTLPAAAPVPAAKDTAAKYTLHPVSSGPYKIATYSPGKSISFVRNTNFDASTDKIVRPLVDAINLTVNSDPDDEDKQLQAGTIDGEADGGVQATFQDKINSDPSLKKNADDPVDGSTRYLVVFPTVAPLDNIDCRKAIFYAINKRALQGARGGTYAGAVANTMANPTVAGYDATANPYPDGAGDTGDLTMAKAELTKCGHPSGFTVKAAYVNAGKGTKVFNATQVALKRVGINVVSAPGDAATYYSRYIGSPANIKSQGLGIGQAGWGADFPTGYGFWNSIVNGKDILPTGNTNYPSLNDPVINNILDTVVTTAGTHADEFQKLDAQVMADAVYLPYLHEKTLYYRNPRLTNVRSNFSVAFGIYDWASVGISS